MQSKAQSLLSRRSLPVLFVLGGCFLLGGSRANAQAPLPVTIGDVETLPTAAKLLPLLRESLEQELKSADFGKSPFRKRYVLDASLVELESTDAKITTATCVVSAMLRTKKDNEVVAVIRGRATAEGSRGSTERTRTEAVKGAARSAIGKVPRALRETEGMR
jgi:hypothetical protein